MFSGINKLLDIDKDEANYYLLMADIEESTCKEAIEWILSRNFAPEKPKSLTLIICSHGGELDSAFALIDVMRGSSIPVYTVGIGTIASAGTMIFMSGKKGYRVLTPNTSIMSHIYTGGSVGKHHELIAITKEFDMTDKKIVAHYKKCTGLSEAQVRKYLLPPQDVYLSADEALEMGICDHVKDLK